MGSDESNKDRYHPEEPERSNKDRLESRDEVKPESDQEDLVVSKKGKKAKPGRC
jgi:hypothetical protein